MLNRGLTNFIAVLLFCTGTTTAQRAVDVHTHNILPAYREVLEKHGAAMEEGFPLPAWDVGSHLLFMEEAGIECSVLTMPAPQPYFGEKEESGRIIRQYNEACAQLKEDYPGKFKFCASVPLPDVESAIREAIYALDTLGADGIKLATNSRGLYLGDEALDTLMAVLNERHAVVIIHPHKPSPFNDSAMSVTPLAIYEYPAETTRGVVNMISRNVPARYPNLKIVIPHCGSFLPLAIPRMQAVHPIMLVNGLMETIDWESNLSRLYYDLAGNPTAKIIETLLSITTADHLLYGSDYPYVNADVAGSSLDKLRKLLTSNPEWEKWTHDILNDNSIKLFRK